MTGRELHQLLDEAVDDVEIPPLGHLAWEAAGRLRRRRRVVRTSAAVLVVALLPVVGVALTRTSSGADAAAVALAPPIPATAPADVRQRLDDLLRLRDDVEAAKEQLMAACMRGQHLVYTPLPRRSLVTRPLPRTFGVPAQALRTEGYAALQDKGTGAGEPPGTRRGSGTDAERYARALYGTPDQGVEVYVPLVGGSLSVAAGGCRGQALRALFPQDAPRALGLTAFLENVASTAFARVDDSPELRPANEAWAACMAGADPGPAQGDEPLRSPYAAEGAASTYVQQHEGTSLGVGAPLQLAVADANCQERTGYRERRTLVEDRYLQGYLDAYAGEVREARDVLTRAGVRARAVLAR